MEPGLARVREQVLRDDGEAFLRTLRALYREDARAWPEAGEAIQRAVLDLGLATPRSQGVALTATGYLVGNVAKEYCNWLDHGRVMPAPRPFPEMVDGKDVLDLGCGFGRWLWEFQRTARSVTGLERQREFIDLGEALAEREGCPVPVIHEASAEDLEACVPPASMDLVFSRLVFTYVPIRQTLAAIATRLRPGGVLWTQVDGFGLCCRNLMRERRPWNVFALVNSVLLTSVGVQLAVRARGRMHATHRFAYPPLRWWRRAVRDAGLLDFHEIAHPGGTVTFWARRPPAR